LGKAKPIKSLDGGWRRRARAEMICVLLAGMSWSHMTIV
jgi:hypothetical protein